MSTNTIPRWTLIIIGIVVLGVLAFYAYKFVVFQNAASSLPEGVVTFLGTGAPEHYRIDEIVLARDYGVSRDDGVSINESVPSPLNAGDAVVLFTIPGERGMFAGVAHADGAIDALVAGDTNKSDLVVLPDGTAIFSASPALVDETSAVASAEGESDDDGVEETGSASGPVEATAAAPSADFAGFPQLIAINIGTHAISSLGLGYSPRLSDGVVRAVAPEGVVAIDVATRARTVLVAQEGESGSFGALSPSGMVAALPSPDNASIKFYRLSSAGSEPIGFLDREPGTASLSLPDEEHLFVRAGTSVAIYYDLPTEKLPVATPVAIVPITQ